LFVLGAGPVRARHSLFGWTQVLGPLLGTSCRPVKPFTSGVGNSSCHLLRCLNHRTSDSASTLPEFGLSSGLLWDSPRCALLDKLLADAAIPFSHLSGRILPIRSSSQLTTYIAPNPSNSHNQRLPTSVSTVAYPPRNECRTLISKPPWISLLEVSQFSVPGEVRIPQLDSWTPNSIPGLSMTDSLADLQSVHSLPHSAISARLVDLFYLVMIVNSLIPSLESRSNRL
jgi:hypothetical protein